MFKRLKEEFDRSPAHITTNLTVTVVLLIVVLKIVATIFSGSAAVLSSLIDSLSDVALSVITLISVRWSLKPADDNHRHGHGKIEGICALIQASCLVGGAAFLLLEILNRFVEPQPIAAHNLTLVIMGLSVFLSWVISAMQKKAAAKTDSLAIESDSQHYSTDMWINTSVFITILVDAFGFRTLWLDPLCALFVAWLMVRAAWGIAQKSFAMLLDEEVDGSVKLRMTALIRSHPKVFGLHDLRAIQSGMRMFISFDIEVDPHQTLQSAHDVARDVELLLLEEFPQAEVMIHLDPQGDTLDSRHGREEDR